MTSSALMYSTQKLIQSTTKRSKYSNHNVIIIIIIIVIIIITVHASRQMW